MANGLERKLSQVNPRWKLRNGNGSAKWNKLGIKQKSKVFPNNPKNWPK